MEFFIDTASLADIRQARDMGLVDGVTTNPSLMAKEGIKGAAAVEQHYRDICAVVQGDVSAEVIATDYDGMLSEARALAGLAKNIVVKIPMTADGLRATRTLEGEGIHVNVTLVFSAMQALLVAKAGATYVSPFIGRLDDQSQEGMTLIEEMVTIFDHYDFNTKVLVASTRHPVHILQAAMLGADVATIPPAVLFKLIKHPLTDIGLEKFLADAAKMHS